MKQWLTAGAVVGLCIAAGVHFAVGASSVKPSNMTADGIRSDLAALIESTGDSPAQKASIVQLASVYEQALTVSLSDVASLTAVMQQLSDAQDCVWRNYQTSANSKVKGTLSSVLNTAEKESRYQSFLGEYKKHRVPPPAAKSCRK